MALGVPTIGMWRKRQYDKLRKIGAVDFRVTTNLLEVEHWLQSMKRIFDQMDYTPEERLDYIMSLLQDDAFD